jgi:hypothetical protein
MKTETQQALETLSAICRQFLDDDYLSNNEILFLRQWIADHRDTIEAWPGDIVGRRIDRALADGIIERDEREYLFHTLELLVDGELTEHDVRERLPIDHDVMLEITGHTFCFGGDFVYGSKAACRRATKTAGGQVLDRPEAGLDYLVVGGRSGADWQDTGLAKYVDAVRALNGDGRKVRIVSEEEWARAIPVQHLLWSG